MESSAYVNIFDIQRSSLHDGPGVRTTVFFKGCPLHCIWCHNPESQKAGQQLKCVFKKCIGCGRCAEVCPENVHILQDGKHSIHFELCKACGACVEACPNNAMQLLGRQEKISDIIDLALRDMKYYQSTGGGLTVSGGEPLMQGNGCASLLKEAKKAGLHTCIETTGYAKWETVQAVAEFTDIFLFDYKLTDPQKHKRYIGVDNRLILENLRRLCEINTKIILRCPIIPGINNDDAHLQALTDLSNQYDAIQEVNIMPYHNIAAGKLPQIGYAGETWIQPSMTKQETAEIHTKLFAMGCKKLNPTA